MAYGLLLTDDEVVALAAMAGRPWPVGLPTVAPHGDAIREAAARGLRSLTVRGIVTEGEQPDSAHPGIAAVIESFIAARHRIDAHIAPVDEPEMLAGASISAIPIADVWWLDSATAQGVHGFRRVDPEQALDTLIEFADGVGDGTLLAEAADPAGYACVIRYGGAGGRTTVVPTGSGRRWDRAALVEACTGPIRVRRG